MSYDALQPQEEPVLDASIPTSEEVDNYDPALENLQNQSPIKALIMSAPAFVASVLIHLLLIAVLAAVYLPQIMERQQTLESAISELQEIEDLDELFEEDVTQELNLDITNDMVVDQDLQMQETEMAIEAAPALQIETASLGDPTLFAGLVSSAGSSGGDLSGRKNQGALIASSGGNEHSQRSVATSLAWFARCQLPDGSWSYNHGLAPEFRGKARNAATKPAASVARMSATAMAILPYLGSGVTHKDAGKYRNTIRDGLTYIKNNAIRKKEGVCFYEPRTSHQMYHQGVVTIAVCEAAAMTRDKDLSDMAQGGIRYLCWAQHDQGGWRYSPKQPGDTSGFGWAFMALKSGQMAYLTVPPVTVKKAKHFLDNVTGFDGGSKYGYLTNNANAHDGKPRDVKSIKGTTAIGLLCQMYLGWRADNPALQKGADFLANDCGPDANNLYYSYYATQVLHHLGGERWNKWNQKMRDDLVRTQEKNGIEAGSWAQGGWMDEGGRLHCTSFATMILEVYYRHLPIYKKQTTTTEFPLDD